MTDDLENCADTLKQIASDLRGLPDDLDVRRRVRRDKGEDLEVGAPCSLTPKHVGRYAGIVPDDADLSVVAISGDFADVADGDQSWRIPVKHLRG